MASTKTYRDYILEQLSEIPDLACRPMMGEFLLYSGGVSALFRRSFVQRHL